jgi:hypothetical protein
MHGTSLIFPTAKMAQRPIDPGHVYHVLVAHTNDKIQRADAEISGRMFAVAVGNTTCVHCWCGGLRFLGIPSLGRSSSRRGTFFHSAGVQRAQMRQNADGGAGQDPDAQGARVQHAGHPEARQGAAAAALGGQQAAPPVKTHCLQEVLRAR